MPDERIELETRPDGYTRAYASGPAAIHLLRAYGQHLDSKAAVADAQRKTERSLVTAKSRALTAALTLALAALLVVSGALGRG